MRNTQISTEKGGPHGKERGHNLGKNGLIRGPAATKTPLLALDQNLGGFHPRFPLLCVWGNLLFGDHFWIRRLILTFSSKSCHIWNLELPNKEISNYHIRQFQISLYGKFEIQIWNYLPGSLHQLAILANFWSSLYFFVPSWPNRLNATKYPWVKMACTGLGWGLW